MLEPAHRLHALRESVIREMTRLALQHAAVNLAQGYPDFPPHPSIIAAVHGALEQGYNQYGITWGIPELRRAISTKLGSWYGLAYDPEREVTVTCGVTEAIVAALLAVVNPRDQVIIIEPFHENYYPAVVFAGATPVFVPLEPPLFELDPDRLRSACSPRTRAIILNSPHNPTGRVFNGSELEGVARLCRERDLVAITDEIYDHILYDGRVHTPLASLEGMFERTITISGLGKTFAITGWRLGYACAPEAFATGLRTIHDFITICAPVPLQYGGVAALELPPAYYADQIRAYTARRARMMAILEENRFTAQPPQGAYYVMADFGAWGFGGDDTAFAHYLTEQVGVATVPGSSFYRSPGMGKQQVRFAFAKRPETFDLIEEKFDAARYVK